MFSPLQLNIIDIMTKTDTTVFPLDNIAFGKNKTNKRRKVIKNFLSHILMFILQK